MTSQNTIPDLSKKATEPPKPEEPPKDPVTKKERELEKPATTPRTMTATLQAHKLTPEDAMVQNKSIILKVPITTSKSSSVNVNMSEDGKKSGGFAPQLNQTANKEQPANDNSQPRTTSNNSAKAPEALAANASAKASAKPAGAAGPPDQPAPSAPAPPSPPSPIARGEPPLEGENEGGPSESPGAESRAPDSATKPGPSPSSKTVLAS